MYTLSRVTPILRIFDEAKAREFYIDFLGFKLDWEHRFEGGDFPVYMQVSLGDCVLHLSTATRPRCWRNRSSTRARTSRRCRGGSAK
jgi:catechol 2,3-dioxygenase-like lactoylglutathione lyase family enzyme